jgi:hypothetical protein
MRYHIVTSSIWEDDKFRPLTPFEKVVFLYLSTNLRCPVSGVYKISLETIEFECGISKVEELMNSLCEKGLIAYDFKRNCIWVRGKIIHSKAKLSHYMTAKSISNDLEEAKGCSWYSLFFDKYPQLMDAAVTLEAMKSLIYNHEKS